MFKKAVLITCFVILAVLAAAGCSSSSVNGVGDAAAAGDDQSLVIKPQLGEKVGAVDAFTDPTPDDPHWSWCNIYGQWYEFGGAELVMDPEGMDPGWYVHYWLSEDACDAGWGFKEVHFAYWDSDYDVNDKKDGIPGKYPYAWTWDGEYDEMPPCEYYLPFDGNFDPETDTQFAIHSVIMKGEWLQDDSGNWYWNETANETGWGANCGGKYSDEWGWDGDWANKWGGWVNSGTDFNYPVFDPVFDECYVGHHWGTYSYWNIDFEDEDWYPFPGSNTWVGWCTDPTASSNGATYCVDVYSSYDESLPGKAASDNWEFISYLINQRNMGEGIYNQDWTNNTIKQHFQNAIWYFKFGYGQAAYPGGLGGQFVDDAIAHGDNYYPMAGDFYAVILYPPNEDFQMNIIEVDP